jgi:hypothetical protein
MPLAGAGLGITICCDVTVTCAGSAHCTVMEPAQVTVTYNFQLLINSILSGSILTMERTAEMLVQ